MKKLRQIVKKAVDNAMHASIHVSDKDIGIEKKIDNAIMAGIRPLKKNLKEASIYDFLDRKDNEAKNTENLHQSLTDHYDFHPQIKGDAPHIEHIKDYTDDSSHINNELWEHHHGRTVPDDDYNHKIRHLDKALKKYKTPKDFTVHAGINYDPREKMDSNNIVHHPAYLSTSLMPHIAEGFAGPKYENNDYRKSISNVLQIHVPKGHPGAYVADHSEMPEEREFIIPRGANLQHTHTTEHEAERPSGKYTIRTHHMKLLNYSPKEI